MVEVSGVSDPCRALPPAPTTLQREYAPGSRVQEKPGVALEVGNGGRPVMTGADGGTVSTSNERVASTPLTPTPLTCETLNV